LRWRFWLPLRDLGLTAGSVTASGLCAVRWTLARKAVTSSAALPLPVGEGCNGRGEASPLPSARTDGPSWGWLVARHVENAPHLLSPGNPLLSIISNTHQQYNMPNNYFPKASDELEALLKRREKLEDKIKQAQARQKEQDRLTEEKRKLVAGGIFLDFIAANDNDLARQLSQLLDKALTRPADRALFPALLNSAGKTDHALSVEKS
jgi:hypothetical protein